MPLGSLLGFLEALSGGLGTPKTFKRYSSFLIFLENADYCLFEALHGLPGLILLPS